MMKKMPLVRPVTQPTSVPKTAAAASAATADGIAGKPNYTVKMPKV